MWQLCSDRIQSPTQSLLGPSTTLWLNERLYFAVSGRRSPVYRHIYCKTLAINFVNGSDDTNYCKRSYEKTERRWKMQKGTFVTILKLNYPPKERENEFICLLYFKPDEKKKYFFKKSFPFNVFLLYKLLSTLKIFDKDPHTKHQFSLLPENM